MKKYSCLAVALLFSCLLVAQNQKTVIEKGISKRVVTEINYEDGFKKGLVEEEKTFDKQGNLIEIKEYNKEGDLKEWIQYTYNKEGQVESECILNAKGKLTRKVVYAYEHGLRKEKCYYDSKNRLVKKKVYDYSYH